MELVLNIFIFKLTLSFSKKTYRCWENNFFFKLNEFRRFPRRITNICIFCVPFHVLTSDNKIKISDEIICFMVKKIKSKWSDEPTRRHIVHDNNCTYNIKYDILKNTYVVPIEFNTKKIRYNIILFNICIFFFFFCHRRYFLYSIL